jgi:hypothetical protein
MTSNWFDDVARRAADRDSSSRRKLVDDAAARLISRAPERSVLDGLAASATTPVSRRTGIRWAFGAALTVAVAPVVNVGSADALFCGKKSAGVCLTDEAIISLTDELLDVEVLGQEFPIFGNLSAALAFYEAAEALDDGPEKKPGACESPDSQCGSACCTPGQICCPCNGGFCLIAGDCSSYC